MGKLKPDDVEGAYEDCCNKLDDLTMQQIDLLEEQLTLAAKVENMMKTGFIEMAESRKSIQKEFTSMMLLPPEGTYTGPVSFIECDSQNHLCLRRDEQGKNLINLFGVLVPRSLRKSQAAFQEALEIIVDLVNTRNEWLDSLKSAQDITKLKKNASLKGKSPDIEFGVLTE